MRTEQKMSPVMESDRLLPIDSIESPEVVARYTILRELGKTALADTDLVAGREVSLKDTLATRRLLAEAAFQTNPPVWAALWEHDIICREMGKRVATQAQAVGIGVNPHEVVAQLDVHDIARLATNDYLRNDVMADRLFAEWGIPVSKRAEFPSLKALLDAAGKLNLDTDQLKFRKVFDDEQTTKAEQFYDSLTVTQRITNLCDNLGKRGPNGLFDLDGFLEYLKSQESRYAQTSQWPSVAYSIPYREAAAVLQADVVKRTATWLTEAGVDLAGIHESLTDYGPKFLILARHGDVENPHNLVYNLDVYMRPEHIIHLSDGGRDQMKQVAAEIKQRRFPVTRLVGSPQTRAQESATIVAEQLGIAYEATKISADLNDVSARDPYDMGMTMQELEARGGDVYGLPHTEKPEHVIERMERAFQVTAGQLTTGEAAVMVVHGDSAAWLLNAMYTGKDGMLPETKDLRKRIYPAKGSASVVILDGEDEYFTQYSLTEKANQGSVY